MYVNADVAAQLNLPSFNKNLLLCNYEVYTSVLQEYKLFFRERNYQCHYQKISANNEKSKNPVLMHLFKSSLTSFI